MPEPPAAPATDLIPSPNAREAGTDDMTASFWFTVGQTLTLLAVCGFALWGARRLSEAADDSALAAEHAVEAARDVERTAADIREMRDMLQTWLDKQQSRADLESQPAEPAAPQRAGRVGTDTAETHAVLTPQAVIARGDGVDPGEGPARDSSRSHRGRHAKTTESPWTAALRAAAPRTSRDR